MSDFIIHNITINYKGDIDFGQKIEKDKPIQQYPYYYLSKLIGERGNELPLKRQRQGQSEKEHVPNCVLRNEGGIALIRVHNKENFKLYDLPQSDQDKVKDIAGVPTSNYPSCYVIIDLREGKCQMAIEKSSAWDNKTVTIRNCFEDFINEEAQKDYGLEVIIKEKTIATKFEDFVDAQIFDHGDIIESITFQYVNLNKNKTIRVPNELTGQMQRLSKELEFFNALSATMTMFMGDNIDERTLKNLAIVAAYSSDNALELNVKFQKFGDYKCDESILAKYPLNEAAISNYRDYITPDTDTSDFKLDKWLDECFEDVKKIKERYAIPRKPKK